MDIYSLTLLLTMIAAIAGWSVALNGTIKSHLHILQLEDYESGRMMQNLPRNPKRLHLTKYENVAIPTILITLSILLGYRLFIVSDSLIILTILLWGWGSYRRGKNWQSQLSDAKKQLVLTSRAKRILFTSLGLSYAGLILLSSLFLLILITAILKLDLVGSIAMLGSGSTIFGANVPVNTKRTLLYIAPFWPLISMYLLEWLSPITLTTATSLLNPVETHIQSRYVNDARRIIRELKPLVIGITGSYGKTSTKEILSALLLTKYNLLRPPGSYNTLMGVTRLIREQLRPYHEALIVEMGAYRIGSIAKLCDLVQPTHGIITIIGVQHLERFKTQDAIQSAKSELIRALPPDGFAILNGNDPRCREIGNEFTGETLYFHFQSAPESTESSSLRIDNINIGSDGSEFSVTFPDGETHQMRVSLLGRSAVANVAAAITMADKLGVSRADMSTTLATLPHVRHRLEPIRHPNGVTVIDDAYNSNPIGARNALEILSASTSGRRILVTPGMVELGLLEEEANYEFGRQAAASCDLAVLVGIKRSEPIKRGLLEEGFELKNIWTVTSLDVGLGRLKSFLKAGDTMLLENDLPDQYNE